MVERLRIARLGAHGEGVADTAAGAVYVPYALPGEIAEVEPWPGHADRRHLTKVEVASPERIAPVCGHFGVCGGCALQHLARSEEHTSELQSQSNLVCRLLLEKKKKNIITLNIDKKKKNKKNHKR